MLASKRNVGNGLFSSASALRDHHDNYAVVSSHRPLDEVARVDGNFLSNFVTLVLPSLPPKIFFRTHS